MFYLTFFQAPNLYYKMRNGLFAHVVKRTDLHELITVGYVSAASAAWTIIVPGNILINLIDLRLYYLNMNDYFASRKINANT